jgi:hypothetical protein
MLMILHWCNAVFFFCDGCWQVNERQTCLSICRCLRGALARIGGEVPLYFVSRSTSPHDTPTKLATLPIRENPANTSVQA